MLGAVFYPAVSWATSCDHICCAGMHCTAIAITENSTSHACIHLQTWSLWLLPKIAHQLWTLTWRLRGKATLLNSQAACCSGVSLFNPFFSFLLWHTLFFPLKIFEHHLQLLPCLVSLVSLPLFVLFLCALFVFYRW